MKHLRLLGGTLALFVIGAALGCGGGGGGGSGDSTTAANVSIDADPGKMDTGDRTLVRVDVSDVHPDGVIVKVKFPVALGYIRASSVLEVEGLVLDIDPSFLQASETERYLVFILRRTLFGDGNYGQIRFVLEGRAATTAETGLVQVDADFNDPTKLDSQKFSLTDPQFAPQDEVTVIVEESGTGTGTGSGGTGTTT